MNCGVILEVSKSAMDSKSLQLKKDTKSIYFAVVCNPAQQKISVLMANLSSVSKALEER